MWLHLFIPFLQLSICIYVPINIVSHSHPQILLRNWFHAESGFFFLQPGGWAWQSSTFICPLVLSWQFLLQVQEFLQAMVSTWPSNAACHTLPSWSSVWGDLAQKEGSFALKTCHLACSDLSSRVSSKSLLTQGLPDSLWSLWHLWRSVPNEVNTSLSFSVALFPPVKEGWRSSAEG